jgi:DNA processing protein
MNQPFPEQSARRVKSLPWEVNERVISPGDSEWPPRLCELGPHKAVARLFVAGRPLDARARAVAIVGTRRPTAAGIETAGRLAYDLSRRGFVVVSGLALGIDAVAHRAALEAGGTTVAVVGAGLDADYPARNQPLRARIEGAGTVVSEHPRGVPPTAFNFPARNRIIVGFAEAVIIVEGTTRSGAMITARLALDADREVFAVPGSARNAMAAGPNELLRRSQAGLVTEAAHVLEEIAPELAGATTERLAAGPSPPLSAES